MKSKISCFNRTIFKKNLTLYWPLWAGWLLLLFAMIPLTLYQYMRLYSENQLNGRQYGALRNAFEAGTYPLLIFAACVVAVLCVFSYLYTGKNTNGIHGLPVTRLELFVTNALSAFTFLAVPEFLCFIASVFVGLGCGITSMEVLLYIFLFQLGMTFFGVAFASTIAMLTGHIMAMPVYCLIANYLYVVLRNVLETLIVGMTYGVNDLWGTDISYVLSPFYYLQGSVWVRMNYNQTLECYDGIAISGGGAVAGYTIAGIFFFILAYQFYRKRHLETAGDVIAVGFMKPIFRIGLGICCGMTWGIGLSELFHFNTVDYSNERFYLLLALVIICSFVGYFFAEMLIQKSFRIFKKKVWLESGILAGAMTVILFALHMDVFGLEKILPNQENITQAWVELDYPVKYEDAAELLAIHEQIITEKEQTIKEISNKTVSCSTAMFKYVLEDGSIFVRRYAVPIDMENPMNPDMPSGKILTKELEAERLKEHFLGANYESNQYVSGYVNLDDQYKNNFEYRLSKEELAVISEALLKDIEQGNYANYELQYAMEDIDRKSDEFRNEIYLQYYNEEGIDREEEAYYEIPTYYDTTINGTVVSSDYAVAETTSEVSFVTVVESSNFYVRFGKKCTNLISALEELGIVNETWHLYTYDEYSLLDKN